MAFLDKKISELQFISTPGDNDRIAIVNLGVTKQTSVSKFLQKVVAATGSFLTNATIAGDQITFTRADGSTFVRTVESASYAVSSSHAVFSLDALSSSFATSASFAAFANDALSSSYASFATSASYSVTASFLDAPVESASIALTASHAFASASVSSTNLTFHRDSGVTAEQLTVPIESASYAITASHALNVGNTDSASFATTASYALEALSASFADFATSASFATTAAFALRVSGSDRSDTASRVEFDLTQGLGIETFTYNGSTAAQVQVDTSSAHFLDPINAATASLSASASTSRDGIANAVSGAFDAVSASLAGDITTNSSSAATALTNLSSSASTAREAISASAALDNTNLSASISTARDVLASQVSGAFQDVSASLSASIAALSASNSTAREDYYHSSSLLPGREEDTIRLFKGSGVDNVTFVTRSFVKTVNGQGPNSVGNVSTTLTAVDTGTSASMLAKSSSGGFDNGEVWIISGESGSLTGSNGRAFIYDSGSGQLYELSNLSEAENDARYVLKAGDTMTGNLVLPAVNPTLANEATRKAYVDLFYDSSSLDAANSELEFHKGDNVTVDIISLAGITVSGSVTASLAFRVEESLNQGLGIETFTYDGDTAGVIVQLDTSSAHFTVGVSASQAPTLTTLSESFSTSQTNLSSSVSTDLTTLSSSASTARQSLSGSASTSRDLIVSSISGAFDAVSASLTTTDQTISSSVAALSASASTARQAISASLTTTDQSISSSVASLSASNSTAREFYVTGSKIVGVTQSFSLGNGTVYENYIDSASYAVSASRAEQALSSSYALTASYAISASHEIIKETTSSFADSASLALTASHAFASASVSSSNIIMHRDSGVTAEQVIIPIISASYAVSASHLIGLVDDAFAQTFTGVTNFTVTHGLNTTDVIVQVYDTVTGGITQQIIPDTIEVTNVNQVDLTFAVATTGYVVVSAGGYLRSGSLQNAQTASYAARVPNTLNQGLGIETFSYDGGTAGVVVQVNTSSAHFLSSSVATSSFALTASYVDGNTYRENVTGATTYTITHNLDETFPVVQTYDTATNRMVLPDYVESQNANQIEISYAVAFTGIVIVQK